MNKNVKRPTVNNELKPITLDPNWPAAMKAATAAAYCGIGERTFRSLVSSGWVVPRKIGPRCIRYLRVDLDQSLSELPTGRGEAPANEA